MHPDFFILLTNLSNFNDVVIGTAIGSSQCGHNEERYQTLWLVFGNCLELIKALVSIVINHNSEKKILKRFNLTSNFEQSAKTVKVGTDEKINHTIDVSVAKCH